MVEELVTSLVLDEDFLRKSVSRACALVLEELKKVSEATDEITASFPMKETLDSYSYESVIPSYEDKFRIRIGKLVPDRAKVSSYCLNLLDLRLRRDWKCEWLGLVKRLRIGLRKSDSVGNIFKVKEPLIIEDSVSWRKEFGIDAFLGESLGNELETMGFTHVYKEGHPVCYNVFVEFQNKELYQNTFADDGKRSKLLRWRIQFLVKNIMELDFSPIVQDSNLKNSPASGKRELKLAIYQALHQLLDNIPQFVAKQTTKCLLVHSPNNSRPENAMDAESGKEAVDNKMAPLSVLALRKKDVFDKTHQFCNRPSWFMKIKGESRRNVYHLLLLISSLLATITFHTALRTSGGYKVEDCKYISSQSQYSYSNGLFITFNSIVFFLSIALLMRLFNELPLRPLLQLSLFSMIGAYMCTIVGPLKPLSCIISIARYGD